MTARYYGVDSHGMGWAFYTSLMSPQFDLSIGIKFNMYNVMREHGNRTTNNFKETLVDKINKA